jgi:hypothetical protein
LLLLLLVEEGVVTSTNSIKACSIDLVAADGCEEEEGGDEFGLVEKAWVVVLVVPGGMNPTTRMASTTPNQRIPTRASIYLVDVSFSNHVKPRFAKGIFSCREEYGPHRSNEDL